MAAEVINFAADSASPSFPAVPCLQEQKMLPLCVDDDLQEDKEGVVEVDLTDRLWTLLKDRIEGLSRRHLDDPVSDLLLLSLRQLRPVLNEYMLKDHIMEQTSSLCLCSVAGSYKAHPVGLDDTRLAGFNMHKRRQEQPAKNLHL
jgi:hypothetical protein